jgi:hypothetical protein
VHDNAADFSGIEQHATSDTDGLELSGSLQPEKRRFANFQKRKSLSSRKQTRPHRLLRDVYGGQIASPFQNAPKLGAAEGSCASRLV